MYYGIEICRRNLEPTKWNTKHLKKKYFEKPTSELSAFFNKKRYSTSRLPWSENEYNDIISFHREINQITSNSCLRIASFLASDLEFLCTSKIRAAPATYILILKW